MIEGGAALANGFYRCFSQKNHPREPDGMMVELFIKIWGKIAALSL